MTYINSDKIIKLQNVKLIFPNLFKFEIFQGVCTKKYSATFMIPKTDTEKVDEILSEIRKLCEIGKFKPSRDKWAFKDGDDSSHENTQGYFTLKAANKKRFPIIDRSKKPVTEDDDLFYNGCRVNAQVALSVHSNNYGKRMTADLLGVQFFANDEPIEIGGGKVGSVDDFDEFEEVSKPAKQSFTDLEDF